MSLRVLALEPWYGGSHRAFLDGWHASSRHAWTTFGLPARDWKWRMRHAALTFADRLLAAVADDEPAPDLVLASDMLDLAAFAGLARRRLPDMPLVLYMHENQLDYPVRESRPRDLHFGMTNVVSALAADAVWFNSEHHRTVFLEAVETLARRMPDGDLRDAADRIAERSAVAPPGIELEAARPKTRRPGPLRIAWAARWEHDKDPDTFAAAIEVLTRSGTDFRLDLLGRASESVPPAFVRLRQVARGRITTWAAVEDRAGYLERLAAADVIVSTARHEYFGLAVVEAARLGVRPILPRRLAYPEIFETIERDLGEPILYDVEGDSPILPLESVVNRLEETARHLAEGNSAWAGGSAVGDRLAATMARYDWERRAPELDDALAAVAR